MTMRTEYLVVCPCGHTGKIKMSENDQPYSKPWERYSLENLIGSGYSTDGYANLEKVFEKMRPRCPTCNRALSTEHLQSK